MSDTPCPLCSPLDEPMLWRDAFCRAIWVDDADYPGFCRVILNAHVREMTDLPEADRQRLMGVVFAVEAVVREIVQPDKINLASLGNVVPHLHWHVIPRWAEDVNFPDAIWAPARRPASVRLAPSPSRGEGGTGAAGLVDGKSHEKSHEKAHPLPSPSPLEGEGLAVPPARKNYPSRPPWGPSRSWDGPANDLRALKQQIQQRLAALLG